MGSPDSQSGSSREESGFSLPRDLHQVLGSSPYGVVLTETRSGRIVFANESFSELTARPLEELLTMRIWQLHPAGMVPNPSPDFEEIARRDWSTSSSQPIMRPDGSLCPTELRAWTVRLEGRELTASIVRDVSERQVIVAERELRATHSNALLDLVGELEQVTDIPGVMDAIHLRVVKYLGFSHSALYRSPANGTHCTRLAIRSSNQLLLAPKDGASFPIEGDELMEKLLAGAETQVIPVARLEPRLDQTDVRSLGLQSIVRVAAGPSSGPRIVLEFVSLGDENVPAPCAIQLEFARGVVSHASAIVERLELSRAAARSSAAITGLLEAVGSYTGQKFFDVLALKLGAALGIRNVLIAEPCVFEAETVRSLSFVKDGELAPPFQCRTAGTPWAQVLRDGFYSIADGAQEAFPEDVDLATLGSRAFLGVSMLDSRGLVLGHLALMHDKPFDEPALVKKVALLFATRAAAELNRARVQHELESSLDVQRKVNELLEISSLPLGLHDKLQRSMKILLGGMTPPTLSGGLRLLSKDSQEHLCETWISNGVVRKDPYVQKGKTCPHHEAMGTLGTQHLTSETCSSCDLYVGEVGVVTPIFSGACVQGTLSVFGKNGDSPAEHVESLAAAIRAIGVMIGCHRATVTLQEAEERLRQSQKLEALGGLAGGIAHDFNNLLTIVLGNAELLLSGPSEDKELHARALEIQAAGRSATRLASQLQAFTHHQMLERIETDISQLVGDSVESLHRLVPENIELKVQISPGNFFVLADAGQLGQVIENLVVNARDAMPNGGEIHLELSRHVDNSGESFVTIVVSDTGIGMDSTTIRRAFEPFFTTKTIGQETGKGIGLGLSIVYGIVRQHGGWIETKSEPGEGARFCIYLPLSQESPSGGRAEPAEAPRKKQTRKRSLVVDDDEAVRRVTLLMLERVGHTVISAGGGDEALALFDSNPDFDVILLDVVMPGMSGIEVFREIRKRHPKQAVLFVTGHDPTESLRDFEGSSGVGLLRKPYTRECLMRKIDDLIGESIVKS